MRYEKNRFQWPNAELTFFILIYHSSLVKGTMKTARVCKLRNGVKKRPQFFLFSMAKGGPSAQ
jgi:hypothetical protein